MSMNDFLAQAYGTANPSDEQEKLASAGMFAKLAAENGVDLNSYSDEEVADLYNTWQSKVAAGGEHGHKHGHKGGKDEPEKKDEKVAAAHAEFMQTKEAQEKFAEADLMGRIMAHSFAQESREIAEKTAGRAGDAAKAVGDAGKAVGSRVKDLVTGRRQHAHEMISESLKGNPALHGARMEGLRQAKSEKLKRIGAGVAAGTAATAAGAAAAHKATSGKKEASAQDEVAAELALYKAAEAGFNPEEAGERLDALFTLGLPADGESKVASAENFEQGMHIRALELLEMVGYPINW